MWKGPQTSRFWIQAALLVIVLGLIGFVAANVAANIHRQSLRFGLDFLNRPAGFSILQTLIPYDENSTYGRAFLVGLLNTLLVAAIGIVAASILGFGIGLARLAPNRPLRWLATAYVEVFRNLPLLLILFFWYFGILRQLPTPRQSFIFEGVYLNNRGLFLPALEFPAFSLLLLGLALTLSCAALFLIRWRRLIVFAAAAAVTIVIVSPLTVSWPAPRGLSIAGGMKFIPEFIALVVALSIYTGAYIAELVRAGVGSVSTGQKEAAKALGLSAWQSIRYVVMPQALRLIIPPLTSQYLNLTKNSSLAVAIAYPDLVSVFAGTTLAQTGQAVEIIAMTMGVYLLLSLITATVMNRWNAKGWV